MCFCAVHFELDRIHWLNDFLLLDEWTGLKLDFVLREIGKPDLEKNQIMHINFFSNSTCTFGTGFKERSTIHPCFLLVPR